MASGNSEWVTDADLELLQGPLDPPGKYEQAAQSLLRRNAMGAVKTVVDLALNAENERVRLSAAQYVLDRVLGKAEQAGAMNPTEKEGWQNIIESVLVEPSAAARATGSDIVRRPRNL